jgi:hypothetical protein
MRGGGVSFTDTSLFTPLPATNLFAHSANGNTNRQTDVVSHSFLSELSSTENYTLDHSMLPATPAALMTPGSGSIAAAAGAATTVNAINGAINITLHQPTLQKYNWMILESLDVRATFYQWLKKNRREKIICDAATLLRDCAFRKRPPVQDCC